MCNLCGAVAHTMKLVLEIQRSENIAGFLVTLVGDVELLNSGTERSIAVSGYEQL